MGFRGNGTRKAVKKTVRWTVFRPWESPPPQRGGWVVVISLGVVMGLKRRIRKHTGGMFSRRGRVHKPVTAVRRTVERVKEPRHSEPAIAGVGIRLFKNVAKFLLFWLKQAYLWIRIATSPSAPRNDKKIHLRFHVLRENRTNMGKISRRPASIHMIRVSLLKTP